MPHGEFSDLLRALERRRSDPNRRTSLNRPNRPEHQYGGLYPPASRAAIQSAEETLGFQLPPLLRAIYSELATGGFGPGTGLIGLADGYTDSDLLDLSLVEYHTMLFEAADELCWPSTLLTVCNLGCNMSYAIDCAESD